MAPNNTRCLTARLCAVLAAIAWGPTLSFGQDYGSYLGQTSGNVITCAEGQAAVSICVGHYFPLQLGAVPERCTIGFTEHDHTLRCVTRPNNDFYWYDVDAKTTKIKANAGEWAFCPPDHVAVSHCGSYTPSALCGGAQQELTCAPISLSYVRLDSTDVIAGCVSSKFNNDCPQGYALTGTCVSHGLFSNNDCNTELCSGKSNIGTGIRCTRIEGYEYAGVGDYTVAESPRFSFDGVCKAQTYSLEGQSDRTITESQTFSTRSSIQTTATSSSSSSQSLTNSLSVTTTVGAEVGFPKLGLGASASTTAESGFEYNTEFERSSSFSEELFSEEEVSTTVTVEYTLQGGLTWTVAYWAAIVTATADYALEFTKYTPGQPGGTTVTENALISTNRLDDRTFTLVLNSDSRSLEFLRSSCRDIATQYMFGIGEFEGLDPDDVVSEYVEGSKGTSPSDDTTDAPAPADAPGGDDGNPDNDGGGGCFSGETTVNVLGKGSVFMKDLQVNEQVYTGNDSRGTAVYQPVFSFGHLEHRAPMEYLRIFHNKAGSPLEISPDHLIFLAHRPAPVRADKLKKGDNLIFKCLACESTEAATITMIKTVTQNGAYLPLTPDGTIVVNNIAASSYVSIDHNTPTIVSHFGLSQHQLFHWWLSPYRMVCMGISSNLCLNDYAGNRIIHWLNIGLYFAKFGEKRHKILQALGVTIVTLLLAILNVTELALGPRLGILVLLLLLFISVSRIIGLRKKKQKCVDGVVEATEKKMI